VGKQWLVAGDRARADGLGVLTVNDGSGEGLDVKFVVDPSVVPAKWPNVGDHVSVIGIATLEGTSPQTAAAVLAVPSDASTLRETASILPPTALVTAEEHPLGTRIRSFVGNQSSMECFRPTGLASRDYLKTISRQVAVFRKCQDASGAIIDPAIEIEWPYSTPCYAPSVALPARTRYTKDPDLIESGVRAVCRISAE